MCLCMPGRITGALYAVKAVAQGLGPVVFGALWRGVGETVPYVTMYAAAATTVLALVTAAFLPRKIPRHPQVGASAKDIVNPVATGGVLGWMGGLFAKMLE